MIVCVKYENLYLYGQAFHSQFRLRHECFIERQDYNVSECRGMEFDQYDTPAAVYLVYLSPEGEAWGCSRLTPVSHGSMLKDLWPELVDQPESVFKAGVWEGTRFCIKKDLPADLRLQICREIVIGYLEAGIGMGAERIIGVMPPFIFKKVFINSGCHHEFLGKKIKISSGEIIRAASIAVTQDSLDNARETTGIFGNIIAHNETATLGSRRVA